LQLVERPQRQEEGHGLLAGERPAHERMAHAVLLPAQGRGLVTVLEPRARPLDVRGRRARVPPPRGNCDGRIPFGPPLSQPEPKSISTQRRRARRWSRTTLRAMPSSHGPISAFPGSNVDSRSSASIRLRRPAITRLALCASFGMLEVDELTPHELPSCGSGSRRFFSRGAAETGRCCLGPRNMSPTRPFVRCSRTFPLTALRDVSVRGRQTVRVEPA
jgi:hypothetical protein